MSEFDVSAEFVDDAVVAQGQEMTKRLRKHASTVAGSGAVEGLGGAVTLVRGVRSLRRGETGRGLARLLVGGLFLAIAATRRRGAGQPFEPRGDAAESRVDQTDVVDTSSPVADLDAETDAADAEAREGEGDPADVADPSVDVEEAERSPELDSDVDAADVDQRDVVETGLDEIDEAGAESTPEENADTSE